MPGIDFGTVRPGTTLYIPYNTYDSNDPQASVTQSGLATTDIEIYKDGSVTQRASDSGYTLLDTDGTDFDAVTGVHGISIDLADNTTAGFYAAGSQYFVVLASITVDAGVVSPIVATFRIGYPDALLNTTIATLASQTSFTLTVGPAENDALNNMWCWIHDVASAVQSGYALISDYVGSTKTVTLAAGTTFTAAATDNISIMGLAPLQSTTLGNTLDVTSTGAAGIDWGNVENKTTANDLSGTDIQLCDTVTTNTDMRGTDSAALASVCTEARLSELDEATAGKMANQMDIVQTDTTTDIPALIAALNDLATGDVDARLEAYGLDHLVSAAVIGTDVADNSIVARLVSSGATADWDTYVNTTDSLQALRDHVGDGTNLTEAGGTGDHLTSLATASALATVDTNVDSILVDTAQIGVAGAGLTDLGGMSTGMMAEVNAECDSALADYDGPTNAEMEARTPTAAQLAYIVANAATAVPVTFTTAGGSTTAAVLNLVDGAAASAVNDQYNGRLLVFTSGTLKDVVTDITDYDGATTTATITTIPTAPTSSHTARMV